MAAPITAAALIAQQVAANAIRDGLFLTWFPVTNLPYFMAAAALVSLPAAHWTGSVLARFGPARIVPLILGVSAVLFLTEWSLLGGSPRIVSGLVYMHTSVVGAIGISAFFSLLNESFDPHSAKPLMARVAAAATAGGLAGGVGAERVAALLSPEALLVLLAGIGGACAAGSVVLGRGRPSRRARLEPREEPRNGWTEIRRMPLLRDLALLSALAAVLAALVDYLLKAEVVNRFGTGEPLVRFFGLFYAGTALAAFLVQALAGRAVLTRAGLDGSVASHSLLVGAAGLIGFVIPAPWRAILPRGLDVVLRASVFKAGYELFYTPLPDAAKRAAKSTVDVSADCLGKGAGAALIVLLTKLDPMYSFISINAAGVLVAGAEFAIARRLRPGYISALEGGLRRQGEELPGSERVSLADFTMARSMAGLDDGSIRRAIAQTTAGGEREVHDDPVVAAISDLRSHDLARIRRRLRTASSDPLLIGALIPLLGEREILKPVISALTTFGARGAGQLIDALLDAGTPASVRRRLPLVLQSCDSVLARDGLLHALADASFDVRQRSGLALLALTDAHPRLVLPPNPIIAAVECELALARSVDDRLSRDHVFTLLSMTLEREPLRIAAVAFDHGDPYLRGTALEYLETVLPPRIFAALTPRLSVMVAPARHPRDRAAAREALLHAAATIHLSRDAVRRELSALDAEPAD